MLADAAAEITLAGSLRAPHETWPHLLRKQEAIGSTTRHGCSDSGRVVPPSQVTPHGSALDSACKRQAHSMDTTYRSHRLPSATSSDPLTDSVVSVYGPNVR
jgi:hypothetical protein